MGAEKPSASPGGPDVIEPAHNADGTLHYAAERGQTATDK